MGLAGQETETAAVGSRTIIQYAEVDAGYKVEVHPVTRKTFGGCHLA